MNNIHKLGIFLLFILGIFAITSCSDGSSDRDGYVFKGNPPVMFSEVCVKNVDYRDEFGEKPGWVEFYNPADTTISLRGYALTNRADEVLWTFGDVMVEPRGYLVVFMSGRDVPYTLPNDSVDLISNASSSWDLSDGPLGKSTVTHTFSKNAGLSGTLTIVDNSPVLSWSNACVILEFKGYILGADQILLRGYLSKNSELLIILYQPETETETFHVESRLIIEGTGIENYLYAKELPPDSKHFPNLKKDCRIQLCNAKNIYETINFSFNSIVMRKKGNDIHASFELNKNGGKLFLMDSQRQVRDSVVYPAETKDLSFAKDFESGRWMFSPPTPNTANSSEVYESQTQQITAINIPKSGYYENELSFTLPSGIDGTIHCNTTGAKPSENDLLKSGSALSLTKTTILRCAQFKEKAYPSEPIFRTYIIGEGLPSLPIVSIAVDPIDMFDPIVGLYTVNYRNDTELPIQIDFFEGGARHAWSYHAGIKMHGYGSLGFPKKSVAIGFKSKYGQKTLNYPLFPEHPHLTKFNWFILRNNGNNAHKDYIRDMLMTSLTEGLGIDYQKGRSVIVYYNGEYFGIHNLRERSNTDYFETNYGIGRNYIDLIKGNDNVRNGSNADYQNILQWVDGVTLNDENLKQLEGRIDLENYTNYLQSEVYFVNKDWPGNNLKRWRSNLVSSKWKWLLYDTDWGFDSNGDTDWHNGGLFITQKMLFLITEPNGNWTNPPNSTLLIRKLLENQNYKKAFINHFSLLLATYYASARVEARIDALMNLIESEIPRDQQRWNLNVSTMNEQLAKIRNFGRNRPTEMQREIEEFFGLSNSNDFTLSSKGNGKILVHNLPVLNGNATFKAYPSVPIIIKATPNDGARFKSWSDGNAQPEREMIIEQATKLEAEFM
jgi:hypothetical protein